MSKIALKSSSSGTATFTIESPATNTDRTMGLPDSAGDLVVTQAAQTLTNKTFSGAQVFGTASLDQPTGNAPLYAARAWVNFNGTGTVAIRASGNVSSITDNSTGNYTVNFTTAMPDANYALSVNAVATMSGRTADASPFFGGAYSTTAVQVFTKDSADITIDSSIVNVAIFR